MQRPDFDDTAERNADHLEEAQLEAFLFGAERGSLAALCEPLLDAQHGACFYCHEPVTTGAEIDHVVPWAEHPDDGLHNLVVAHARCNNRKRDALPAVAPHLQRWSRRFDPTGPGGQRFAAVAAELEWPRWPHRTLGAARGLYLWLPPRTPLWQRDRRFVPSVPGEAAAVLGRAVPPSRAAEHQPDDADER